MSQARKPALRFPSRPFRYEGQFRQRTIFRLGVRHTPSHPSTLYCQPLRVDLKPSPGITPTTPLLWVGPTAMPPYLLLTSSASLKASGGNDTALPSSDANRWITCHGLRPRPGTTHSPNRVPCCWLPGHETLGPAATMNITGLNTFTCVVADKPPSLRLHTVRYLPACKVLFWPGG